MRNLLFLISEAQRNFRNELFDSVEAQHNSAIAEGHFRTKLKRNTIPQLKFHNTMQIPHFLQFLTEKSK